MSLLIKNYIDGLSICLKELSHQDIADVADIIFKAYKKNKQIFILGNGGSASTASHFARDLRMGTVVSGKKRMHTTSLTDNVVMITSLANDIDYKSIFKEQLVDQLNEGDVVIGISASGNSPNVLSAIEYARENGAITIALTGFGGGKLKELADKAIIVSSHDYGQVEDVHLSLDHIITCAVKDRITNE
ncbi:MAG: SIS domain-containing protein [Dehalococcoidia bacterium]|nr:MAG: SIS domain-containing protein [Dehalococcoidia bacterium]